MRLVTLGGLSLRGSGSEASHALNKRPRKLAVLTYLALAGGACTRDQLADAFWGDQDEARARHSLSDALWELRRALGAESIVADGAQLRLTPDAPLDVDARELADAVRTRDFARAVQLYGGPFLDGVHASDAGRFEQFVARERERLRALFVQAARQHCSALARSRGWEECEKVARSWLDEDIAGADAALFLLNAQKAPGTPEARQRALATFRSLAARLDREYDREPDAGVVKLAASIAESLDGAPEVAASAPPPASSWAVASPVVEATVVEPVPSAPVPVGAPPALRWHGRGRRRAVAAVMLGIALAAIAGLGVRRPGRGEAAPARAAAAAPAAAGSTVAVLPFVDMSPGSDHAYFSDGLSEELINALSKEDGLSVVARTSAFSFKGRNLDVREIGRALGAAAVVEGSVRRAGGRLRVTAQLIDARNGYHLWSETYERDARDVFAVQDEISHRIAETLRPRLGLARSGAVAPASPASMRAVDRYLQGRYHMQHGGIEGLRKAVASFQAALREDSTFAPAHAGLAESYNILVDASWGRGGEEDTMRLARQSARSALRLDPDLPEAHVSLGHLSIHSWDWDGAEAELRRAISLQPSNADAHRRLGILLAMRGDFGEGVANVERALALDPLSATLHHSAGYVNMLARRFPAAAARFRTSLAMDSTHDAGHLHLGSVLTAQGRYDEATRHVQTAIRLRGGRAPSAIPMLGFVHATAGRRAEAERVAAEVERLLAVDSAAPYAAAALFGVLGERDRAFAILDRLAGQRNSSLVDLGVDHVMDPLRGDPRFDRLLRRVGLWSGGGPGDRAP